MPSIPLPVKQVFSRLRALALLSVLLAGCAPTNSGVALTPSAAQARPSATSLNVLAAETFLADISQNVAGDRLRVKALIPVGVEPHAFQPTPADVKKVADSQVLIVNGAGLEEFLAGMLKNAGGQRQVVEAAAGLVVRQPRGDETGQAGQPAPADEHPEGDPHFWLDPVSVITYVANIRAALSQADPAGAATYAANAEAYIARLKELDRWISEQVRQVPEAHRKLVTNHESFGYFADRYGFEVVGAIIPSVSTGAAPSAQQLARLTDRIKAAGAPAIFLETGANPQLARQLSQEVSVKVVTDLYTHSITDAGGPAPTYLDMIRFNVNAIVAALK